MCVNAPASCRPRERLLCRPVSVNDGQTKNAVATDWPTIVVVTLFWALFVATVREGHRLSTVLVVAALAVLGGLYMSLQHETIHGHPTPFPRFNWLLTSAPLGVMLPLDRYRDTHLAHHRADLTNPIDDPESHYVTPEAWSIASGPHRLVLRVNRTMAGRLTIGPLLSTVRMWRGDLSRLRHRPDVRRAWILHVVAVTALILILRAAGLPLWIYMLGFVFGGASLTALRSFVEHAAVDNGVRSAMVHTGWFFSLIFLNNNLHYTHHQLPGASWFRLAKLTHTLDAETLVTDGAGVYRGYRDVARRFLFRPFGQPVYPLRVTIDE